MQEAETAKLADNNIIHANSSALPTCHTIGYTNEIRRAIDFSVSFFFFLPFLFLGCNFNYTSEEREFIEANQVVGSRCSQLRSSFLFLVK